MSDKLIEKDFIRKFIREFTQESEQGLDNLANKAKEHNASQIIAERITGQGYEPAKVVAALKALS